MLPFCVMSQEIAPCDITTLREDRHAAEENFVAEATRRRRRSSRASFFLDFLQESYSWKFFLCTKGGNGIMERETEPEEQLPVIRGSKSSKGEWRL